MIGNQHTSTEFLPNLDKKHKQKQGIRVYAAAFSESLSYLTQAKHELTALRSFDIYDIIWPID